VVYGTVRDLRAYRPGRKCKVDFALRMITRVQHGREDPFDNRRESAITLASEELAGRLV